jgi:glycosyltransferase involved in cell wall biosynthesis
VHLLLVGDVTRGESDGYATEVRRLAVERMGVRAVFHPPIADIENAYAALDVFVLPSHSETYGMVTIEAMASGLPVIATNSGGTVDIVDDGRTGLLFSPEDVDELRAALGRLIDAPDLAVSLGKSARGEAVTRFSHIRQCESLEALFDRLLSGAGVARVGVEVSDV